MAAQRDPESEEALKVFNKIIRKLGGETTKIAKKGDKKLLLNSLLTYLLLPMITGFDKLTVTTMERMLKTEPVFDESWVMPKGRLRKPYEQAMKQVFPTAGCDFSKLTIKAMREFLELWGLQKKN